MGSFSFSPLITIVGASSRPRLHVFLVYILLWLALGLQISWPKAGRGSTLHWVGFELSLHGTKSGDTTVRLTEPKRRKLFDTLQEIRQYKGLFPLKLLQHAVGVSRPWLAMLWAAITQHRDPVKDFTRIRKGLIFVRQVQHAVRWLSALVHEMDQCRLSLQVTFRWQLLIQTDACPAGMGGFLSIAGQIVAYWSDAISDEDCQLLGATRGDPAFQSENELLAVWISRCFCQFHHSGSSWQLCDVEN